MKRVVQLQPATCLTCHKFHSPSKRQRAKVNPIPTNAQEDILASNVFVGKATLAETPRSNRYILTMIELFTKFGVAATIPEQSSQTVADTILSRWLLLFGALRRLLTYQQANFESAVVQILCTIWGIDKVCTTAYHSPGNRACERLNQTSKDGLQKMLKEKRTEEWDVILSEVLFAYNTSVHSTTGFTPYFHIFGVEEHIPSDILVGFPEMEPTPAGYAFYRYQNSA